MKRRTVYHITKNLKNINQIQSHQSANLFPFLHSKLVQQYSKQGIKFKKVYASCNLHNLSQYIPYPHDHNPYQFLFLGRSNVGKSTLLNELMQSKVAAVSKRPGKTKQLLFCQLKNNIKLKKQVNFVDAPGYGYATGVSKKQIKQWGKLLTKYLSLTKQNSLRQNILCLLDINIELKETDVLVFNLLKKLGKNFQIIFTKCDKMKEKDFERGLETVLMIQQKYEIMNFYVHFTSCHEMMGVDNLRNHILFQILNDELV